ncbi:hypothetical protein NDU88_006554 [Pleurodeles waltl]|uniref:Uncharacterized protein n=1 Tax=Pleurodeles waltl TaxID=8319 RepID=A0AAV7N8Z1_PLEWA|nr:hypothetical protein NDU88_006554 [Pleurodeles waltl]
MSDQTQPADYLDYGGIGDGELLSTGSEVNEELDALQKMGDLSLEYDEVCESLEEVAEVPWVGSGSGYKPDEDAVGPLAVGQMRILDLIEKMVVVFTRRAYRLAWLFNRPSLQFFDILDVGAFFCLLGFQGSREKNLWKAARTG